MPDADEPEDDLDPGLTEQRSFRLTAEHHGLRLDRVLALQVPQYSRSHLQGLVAGGHVALDGVVASVASRKVQAGQALVVDLVPPADRLAFLPGDVPLAVVYEDEDVLVIDKPAGLVVHPAAGNWSGTVLNGLLARDPRAAQLPRAGIVHRLDKDTSGLMVVGRSLFACTALVRAIAERRVQRRYQAIAEGDLGAAPFSVDAPVGRHPTVRVRMAVTKVGKPARTDFEPVARAHGCSAVLCTLHSGRTHQIRVHLAHRGHPLVADALYGGKPALGLQRQALHAAELAFAHPADGRPMAFRATAPEDFVQAWDRVTRD